jgi:hypothetical protein
MLKFKNKDVIDYEKVDQVCCLCSTKMTNIYETHNPFPLAQSVFDRCCSKCNTEKVTPARNHLEKLTLQENIENLQEIVDDKKYSLSSMSINDMNETREEIQHLEEEIEYCKIQLLESESE